jgi:hypothetical protein
MPGADGTGGFDGAAHGGGGVVVNAGSLTIGDTTLLDSGTKG